MIFFLILTSKYIFEILGTKSKLSKQHEKVLEALMHLLKLESDIINVSFEDVRVYKLSSLNSFTILIFTISSLLAHISATKI